MGKTIAEYQAIIKAALVADPNIVAVTADTSLTADWLLWTWIVATSQWITDNLFTAHKAEVLGIIGTQKPHTLQWYATIAKLFQYGDSLPADTDVYAVIDKTKQIVAFSAAIELPGLTRIKAAKLTGGVLAALAPSELTAFTTYMGRVKDAGVRLQCTSGAPDDVRLTYDIYYDPLVLDATGKRLDGTSMTPVQDAITAFLDELPFNGLFVPNFLIDAIQAVEGVRISRQTYCAARYGILPYTLVGAEYNPDAGYLVMDAAYFTANTNYYPHGPI